VDTVIFHIDALTGEDVSGVDRNEAGSALQGRDIISGPMIEAYLLDHDDSKVILLLDEFLQVRLFIFPFLSELT
jgi:ER membrane protein complex subunit 1